MSTIDTLNTQYERVQKDINVLKKYDRKVSGVQNDSKVDTTEKVARSVELISQMMDEMDCSSHKLILSSSKLGTQYIECIKAIDRFKIDLLSTSGKDASSIRSDQEAIKQAQTSFAKLKKNILQEDGYNADSVEGINGLLSMCIGDAIKVEEVMSEKLIAQAKELFDKEYSVNLKKSDPLQLDDTLPGNFLVGRIPLESVSQRILKDIGFSSSYEDICTDLRTQGNVIVGTDFRHMADESIDAFVIAYVLRFIETFPLGIVNVHIFNGNANYLYKRLNNSFQAETSGETTKKTVQIHTDLSDLEIFRDVNCEDIFKKTSTAKPDLYAVYDDDKSDPFNLIVLRDGFVDGSGYVSTDIIDVVNSLTKPGGVGHKCGLRFLIIDNSVSFEKNLAPNNKFLIESIQKNCNLRFYYNDGVFSYGGKPADILKVSEDLDVYTQERSKYIAELINNKEKGYVTLDDVSIAEINENVGNIMYIPVGKSGSNTVELPFSCNDIDGTVAGQCIGYMVIGQSGSGKSSFFHSVVLNGCIRYSPKDLQFWLLDFKNGGASSKYSNCGIPHIRIVAENNKIDDALCLFQMILEEMERRSKAFNDSFTNNIVEYNEKADANGMEHFPRILIAIDEVQEIFREDNASELQKYISSISARMRSAGMHFIMVAQNLSEGKSYMLKDAFLPSATGRVCFRVAPDIPRDSGYEDDFIQRRQEIAELKAGEAYVSYGKDTIKKVKMAYISPQDMSERYFADICKMYPDYSDQRPLVIGSKKRLSITSMLQGVRAAEQIKKKNILDVIMKHFEKSTSKQEMENNYLAEMESIHAMNDGYEALIGEDVYRMSPWKIKFSQHENSSALLLGSDKKIASSLCASIAVSLIRQNVEVHLFNGDRTKIAESGETVPHPFMYVCQSIASSGIEQVSNHRLDQLKDVLKNSYSEYLKRQALVQSAEDEDPVFKPLFIVINDLFGIESFSNNDIIESDSESGNAQETIGRGLDFNYDIFGQNNAAGKEKGQYREGIQNIMNVLLKNGYRYNMHVVLAIKGDPATWRTSRITSDVNNIILFNEAFDYADQVENGYYLKEMLKNISNDGRDETMAVSVTRKSFSKIRPIIYKMNEQQERDALEKLVKGEDI